MYPRAVVSHARTAGLVTRLLKVASYVSVVTTSRANYAQASLDQSLVGPIVTSITLLNDVNIRVTGSPSLTAGPSQIACAHKVAPTHTHDILLMISFAVKTYRASTCGSLNVTLVQTRHLFPTPILL